MKKRVLRKDKSRRKFFVAVLIVVLFLIVAGGIYFFTDKVLLSPGGAKVTLAKADLDKIATAKNKLVESDGHDYSGVYEAVKSKKGNLKQINAVCDEVSKDVNPVFCYKKASQENPSFRKDICNNLRTALQTKYGNKINVEGHVKECLMGIPQMAY